MHINATISVEGMQYRNNNEEEWKIIADETTTIIDDEKYYEYARLKSEFNNYIKSTGESFIISDGQDLENYINITPEYLNKVAVLKNELILLDRSDSEVAVPIGYTLLSPDVYDYYKELRSVEKEVAQIIAGNSNFVGTALGFSNYVSIGGLGFGAGWHFISESTAEQEMGISVNSARSGGFIVKYTTGEVLSVNGKLIEKGTDTGYVYSLNYTGQGESQLYMNGMLTGVGNSSTASSTKWGETTISNAVTPTYDANNGLILGSQIAQLAIDQTKPVDERFSINVTVKGGVPQASTDFPKTIVAISATSGEYLSWIGICNNYLHIYSFYPSAARSGINREETINGFTSIDLTKYGLNFNREYLNLQVTAERNGLTKVYINGELFKTFNSGSGILNYGTMTVGDLRSGRGLKYNGAIYNLALYSEVIPAGGIAQNWEYTKNQLGID